MNVAQLKLIKNLADRRKENGFPRLNERGSIEAIPQGSSRHRGSQFPRLNERGSIEASWLRIKAGSSSPVSTFE